MKQTASASENGARPEDVVAGKFARALREAAALLRAPQRAVPLIERLVCDEVRVIFEQRHLYSYAKSKRSSIEVLHSVVRWILEAQRPDGGIAAYYSLLSGYSKSYPEVTGYIVPTLYDFAFFTDDDIPLAAAEQATQWLLSLQMASGAFPAGLQGGEPQPSVFNTGQILQGLIRAHRETNRSEILQAAVAAGDWLIAMQQADGSWRGPGVYQEVAHTYYSMVSWALVELSELTSDRRYAQAAEKNLDWVLLHFRPSGWIDGINLCGHLCYSHFVAYALQGVLECAILRRRSDAVQAVARSAWVLLKKFETSKFLPGAFEADFRGARNFTCLTGNAQMSCVWLRLFEVTGDLRYLNAALKMNEMVKQRVSIGGRQGIAGGVGGSYPVWGSYQPLRYVSWGCKFFADSLLMEERLTQSADLPALEVERCAS